MYSNVLKEYHIQMAIIIYSKVVGKFSPLREHHFQVTYCNNLWPLMFIWSQKLNIYTLNLHCLPVMTFSTSNPFLAVFIYLHQNFHVMKVIIVLYFPISGLLFGNHFVHADLICWISACTIQWAHGGKYFLVMFSFICTDIHL